MRDRIVLMVSIILVALVIIKIYGSFEFSKNSALDVVKEGGYQNTVTTIYLKDRMYDTIFEVLIFSLVVLGVEYHHKGLSHSIYNIKEETIKSISGFFGFLAMVFSLYIAVTGHKYPGGGFTAGVAGGTALMLMGFARGFESFETEFEKFKVNIMEKVMVVIIIITSIIEFRFKADLIIIFQNVFIYFKVMAGTWIITYNLMKHRGIV
ncbi:MAG: cation:proton antiporter [Thermotogaceae bacterium]|nr:cation:proton antiporter [Thermotogaceae bacterium]